MSRGPEVDASWVIGDTLEQMTNIKIPKEHPMTTTYIHHSCFLVETTTCYYLFDYEKGILPAMDVTKPIFVLSSHAHRDHYNAAT